MPIKDVIYLDVLFSWNADEFYSGGTREAILSLIARREDKLIC